MREIVDRARRTPKQEFVELAEPRRGRPNQHKPRLGEPRLTQFSSEIRVDLLTNIHKSEIRALITGDPARMVTEVGARIVE
jgi:hypothetical protein